MGHPITERQTLPLFPQLKSSFPGNGSWEKKPKNQKLYLYFNHKTTLEKMIEIPQECDFLTKSMTVYKKIFYVT